MDGQLGNGNQLSIASRPAEAVEVNQPTTDVSNQSTTPQTISNGNSGTNGQTKESPGTCLMCLQSFDELGSIGSESPEELKRIVDNIFKIAKIEVKAVNGKIEPLCSGCRAKLGYDYDEDAYYEMLSQMYSNDAQSKTCTIAMQNGVPVHIAMPCDGQGFESPPTPGGIDGHYIDAACGTFVVTELGVEALNADKDDLVCAICSKAFNFKSTLRLHIRSHHQTAPRETIELPKHTRKPRTYECVECNLSFKLKYDFDKHIGSHKKPTMHQCEGCFKLFKHRSYYLMHRNLKRCKAQLSLDLNTSVGEDLGVVVPPANVPPATSTSSRRRNGAAKARTNTASISSVSALLQCNPELASPLTDCGIRNTS
ncbi:zinc finger protein 599-like [Anopheles ziemanni]|uniref:zinc finger protein 599-like n=1 Tax=Anopheles coustani TaxID=139045 RepID=UPI00265B2A58|nr:zinc finger protein 599-like [Anopheles coustani]XP_058172367.1 zinc finger protein 599-like [Anopheles ziemanni]